MRWLPLVSMLLVSSALSARAGELVIAGYGDSLTGTTSSKWCGKVEAPDSCDPSHANPGERTLPGSARLQADLSAGNVIDPATTHVTLAWGANDIRQIQTGNDAVWLSDFEQPLRDAADAVRAAGLEPVLVITLDQYKTAGPACVPEPVTAARIDAQVAPRIQDIADDYDPPLVVVDLNAAYDSLSEATKCPGNYLDGLYSDHVHQTDAGYLFMRDVFLEAIAVPQLPGVPPGLVIALLGILGAWSAARRD